MTESTLTQLSPQATAWGEFDCGDPRVTRTLVTQARHAAHGLRTLYGAVQGGEVVAAMTLCAGELQAPMPDLHRLGGGQLRVPTVHLDVLAVRLPWQGQGLGGGLLDAAIVLTQQISGQVGVKTLSLDATAESRDFYLRRGFTSAQGPWTDGSWAMWLVLDGDS